MTRDVNKIAIISLSIACIVFLCLAALFYIMKIRETSGKDVVQRKLDDITVMKYELEKKIENAEALTGDLKVKLKRQEDEAASTTKLLDEEKVKNSNNLVQLEERENEIGTIKSQLENEVVNKNALLAKFEKVKEDYDKVKLELEKGAKAKEESDKNAKESIEKEGVSLGTIELDRMK